jgi:hypothetical protein
MTAAPQQLHRLVRHGRDALLLGIAGLLVAAVVNDLRHQVVTTHRQQLDERTFRDWARGKPAAPAFSRVRVVSTRRSVDVVCGTLAAHPGRVCLAVTQDPRGARALAATYVAPGTRAVRHGRLNCRWRRHPACVPPRRPAPVPPPPRGSPSAGPPGGGV